MDDKQTAMLVLMNTNRFTNLLKLVNNEKFKNQKTLTEKQFFALSRMMTYDKIELKNLSRDLFVSTSSLCILLNKLVEKGYVYREEDTRDRRNTFYGITEEGRRVLNEEIDEILEIMSAKFSLLEEEELNRLSTAMDEVKDIIAKLY